MTKQETVKPLARNNGCEVLGYFADVICSELKRHGLKEHDANDAAASVMLVMKREFGGQVIYFPKGAVANNNDKASAIFAQFQAGKTIPELVFESGHSVQWVYRMIAHARETLKAERAAKY